MKHLVIVESPTKARTISKFLSRDYKVESSFGHICDLPASKLGVDVDNNFEPTYVVPVKAKKQVAKLKELAAKADEIILATDQDREGEAIAWHLKNILKPKKYSRIAFHEITKKAIDEALSKPHDLDLNVVDAQQARRVLDRLVGYQLSPFLWKKVARGLSAGRVQSVAVRLVVEKEREREAFKQDEYWTIEALFSKDDTNKFPGKLFSISGKSIGKLGLKTNNQTDEILKELANKNYYIANIELKTSKKTPPVPFTTSTLQQAANNQLNFSAKQTMMIAQTLYEGVKLGAEGQGLITYMRTDSLNLSDSYLNPAREYIQQQFGAEYLPKAAVKYHTKSKGAQEAHEAIRPTDVLKTPESVQQHLDANQFKLYKLIWERTLATQMTAAVIDATALDINDETDKYTFRATGQTVKFPGFLKVYPTGTKEITLPTLNVKDKVKAEEMKSEQHFTQPPARYTEASLVKVLEEYGIGRPSTYAPTIATIQERGYVEKEAKALKPTEIGCLVNDILVEHFKDIVDYEFTADMEKQFDEIEDGKKEWQPVIAKFYGPFKKNLDEKTAELTKKSLTEEKTDEVCDKCGSPMVIKVSRHGKFLACSKYPECKNTKSLDAEGKVEAKEPEKLLEEKCPDCGSPLTEKHGRFGPFVGCSNYPKCKYIQKKDYGTGVHCPQCEAGEIVSKRTRGGKIFFACNKYPDCKFALWSKPTGEKCPECKALMVYAADNKTVCSNKECAMNK